MWLRKLKKIVDVSFDVQTVKSVPITTLALAYILSYMQQYVNIVHMKYIQKDTNSISEDPTLLADTYSYFTNLLSNKKPDPFLTN